jgi:hypothetical protein
MQGPCRLESGEITHHGQPGRNPAPCQGMAGERRNLWALEETYWRVGVSAQEGQGSAELGLPGYPDLRRQPLNSRHAAPRAVGPTTPAVHVTSNTKSGAHTPIRPYAHTPIRFLPRPYVTPHSPQVSIWRCSSATSLSQIFRCSGS